MSTDFIKYKIEWGISVKNKFSHLPICAVKHAQNGGYYENTKKSTESHLH